jgi:hypothetical protein
MRLRLTKTVAALGFSLVLLSLFGLTGQGAPGRTSTVTITSVSGYAGHAFVYAEVSDANANYPAPSGTGHHSPFFSEWIAEPFATSSCPWIWAVYVFDRLTGRQVNVPSGPPSSPNFGTTTTVCASPTHTPVEQPPTAAARARLDLDLEVAVSPAVSTVGSPSLVTGRLNGRLSQDLNLYLSMAIEDWRVSRWTVDFGDGQAAALNGTVGSAVQVQHSYGAAGRYDASLKALITGHAQAAVYDGYGNVNLIRQPFSVEVGNHAIATARPGATRAYLPPQAVVAVTPAIGTAIPSSTLAFRSIDALRGALTTLAVRLWVTREGVLTIDGTPNGRGSSRLTGWRLDGPGSDAPPGRGTVAGVTHSAADPLRLQWNSPDRLLANKPAEYEVPLTLFVATRYPDRHVAVFAIQSSFTVSVNFAALGG